MKSHTIKAIFTNLLFLAGVLILFAGFSKAATTATRLVVFDKYPIDSYAETRCNYPAPIEGEVSPKATPDCLESIEYERKVKLTDDIVNSITLLVTGAILTLSFRRFIFERIRQTT